MDPLIGYRFNLNDKAIITELEKKMHNRNIDFPMIREVDDMCNHEPWNLNGFLQTTHPNDQEWYFFNPMPNQGNMRRATNDGYWKATSNPIVIYNDENEKIGEKIYLVYHSGHGPQAPSTPWIIHEFHSVNEETFQDRFVLCHLKYDSNH